MSIAVLNAPGYCLAIATAFCAIVYAEANCYCGYRRSGMVVTLRCSSEATELPRSVFRLVLCERMGDIVRIGDSSSVTAVREEAGVLGMAIEPYGLSQLQFGGQVVKLQLNLPLQAKLLDALAFAGLPDLKTFHAWRAPIALEGCSLAGLSKLESLVLSCGSTFDRYITFGPSFKSVRLIGCLGRPLQFICTQCTQRPDISVLRILPGPPSHGGIVTFESWWNSSQATNSVVLGKCRPGVCSDEHICRHSYALKLSRTYRPRKTWTATTPVLLTTSSGNGSPSFISIFLPILALVLVLSIALCLFMSLRISGKLKRKRKLVHRQRGGGGEPQVRPEPTAPPDTALSSSVPLNGNSSIKS
ncbi:unnamed protein product [Taenia asiatica]|uniref:Recep_L_domain domain-containing protein n=1 Tax=Taenia asiatica TaxID=60517 RepID=A0A0R3W6Z0_TAEAS|nr:unnamed protein product [Taenia asiatica]